MKKYVVIFISPNEIPFLREGEKYTSEDHFSKVFKGQVNLSDSESCLIFAIEDSFNLNLIREVMQAASLSGILGLDVSLGTLDEDEMEWMTSFDLAA